MDLKKMAAQKAVTLITPGMTVGLGAGSTIAFMVVFLKQSMGEGLAINFVTSSFSTFQLLLKNGFPVGPINSRKEIDIYFDGCDQLDYHLNALKSGGGIHTMEKLLANMSAQFILVGDESKLVNKFDVKYPLVLEILPQAMAFVPFKMEQLFKGSKSLLRMNDKKDGPVITENGNYLLDIYFEEWPVLNETDLILKDVTGIIETSLFYLLAHRAIIAVETGIRVLERK